MASRKDNKGRVLKTGESQRKDGGYDFRYYDSKGKRHSIYAPTLNELREKESAIQKLLLQGINYTASATTVIEQVNKYLMTREGLSYNTQRSYEYVIEKIKACAFADWPIRDVKSSDAKCWFSLLSKSGLGYWSIQQIKGVISPAFEMAVEDEVLNKNPFDFSLSKVVQPPKKSKEALSYTQQKTLLSAFQTNPSYSSRYELIAIMLGTGMRVGELTGLTFNDVDMDNKLIHVNHQLHYNYKRGLYITAPKSESGNRTLPMSDMVYSCFKAAIANRRFVIDEPSVDGYTGFIFLTKRGNPDYVSLIQQAISAVVKDHNRNYPDNPLPHLSPHILRHTFCTNMIHSGVSVKQTQYLMGHATASVTMNVYAHAVKDQTESGVIRAMNDVGKKLA